MEWTKATVPLWTSAWRRGDFRTWAVAMLPRTLSMHKAAPCVDDEQVHREELREDSLGSWQFFAFLFWALYEAPGSFLWLLNQTNLNLYNKLIHSFIHSFFHSLIQMASVSCSQRI